MTFPELLTELQKLKREEQRVLTDNYMEIVISRDDLDPLHKVLAIYFGSPLKSEGQPPSGEANRHAKSYGGIRKDQTMYFRQDEVHSEYAFLWPWGSGTRITVKIIQAPNSGSRGNWKRFIRKLFGCN